MRPPVYSSVMPRADLQPAHPRANTAGVVIGYPSAEDDPDGTRAKVRWDADQVETVEVVANLRVLG